VTCNFKLSHSSGDTSDTNLFLFYILWCCFYSSKNIFRC